MQANKNIFRMLSLVLLVSCAYAQGMAGGNGDSGQQGGGQPRRLQSDLQSGITGAKDCSLSKCLSNLDRHSALEIVALLLAAKEFNNYVNVTGYAGDALNWLGKGVGLLGKDYFLGTKVDPKSLEARVKELENKVTVQTANGPVNISIVPAAAKK